MDHGRQRREQRFVVDANPAAHELRRARIAELERLCDAYDAKPAAVRAV